MTLPVTPYSGDQFGFYTVGQHFKTYSKLLAIEEMRRTGRHLKWNFNKQNYSKHDWTKEPKESLESLYRRRAQQIRDNYDYVVIWYSGGPDSWCVLDTFVKNHIKIDEIASFHAYEGDKNRRSVINEEIFCTAFPKAQEIISKNPGIRHRMVDISDIIVKVFDRPDYKFDFSYDIKSVASANYIARQFIRDYVEDYKNMIASGKRVCFVYGSEKPRITTINHQYHVAFIDAFADTGIRIQKKAHEGYFDEWFFWSPDTADIIAKQCHILLKVLNLEPVTSPWMTDRPHGPHNPKHKITGKFIRNDIYHTLIYPGWDPATLVAMKPQNLLIAERDDWFWGQTDMNWNRPLYSNNSIVQNAWGGVATAFRRFGDDWLHDPLDWSKGLKGCINTYALEKNCQVDH